MMRVNSPGGVAGRGYLANPGLNRVSLNMVWKHHPHHQIRMRSPALIVSNR